MGLLGWIRNVTDQGGGGESGTAISGTPHEATQLELDIASDLEWALTDEADIEDDLSIPLEDVAYIDTDLEDVVLMELFRTITIATRTATYTPGTGTAVMAGAGVSVASIRQQLTHAEIQMNPAPARLQAGDLKYRVAVSAVATEPIAGSTMVVDDTEEHEVLFVERDSLNLSWLLYCRRVGK